MQIDGRLGVTYVAFVDLGAVHDPTVIAVGHEEDGCAFIDRLETYQGRREEPVQIARIEEAVARVAKAFEPVAIRVESWQGLGAVQPLSALGLPVEPFTPTQKTNAEEWPILGQRLAARTLDGMPQTAPLRQAVQHEQHHHGDGLHRRVGPPERQVFPREARWRPLVLSAMRPAAINDLGGLAHRPVRRPGRWPATSRGSTWRSICVSSASGGGTHYAPIEFSEMIKRRDRRLRCPVPDR